MQGKTELALTHLEAANAARPGDPRVAEQLGLAHDQRGEFAKARAVYESGLRAAPRHLGLRTRLGLSLASGGEYAPAIETLSDVTSDPAAGVEHRRSLAMVMALAGERDRAVQVVRPDLGDARAREAVANWASLRGLDPARRTAAILGVQRAQVVLAAAPPPEVKGAPVTPPTEKVASGTANMPPRSSIVPKPPADPVRGRWVVQAGAFSSEANARQRVSQLKAAGFEFEVTPSGNLFHVRSVPQPNFKDAAALARKVQATQGEATVVPLPPQEARG